MSHEPTEPWYLSHANYREWALPVAFGPLDAGLGAFLSFQRPTWRESRTTLSSASARYLAHQDRSERRAWIDLRMVDTDLTLILLNIHIPASRDPPTQDKRDAQDRWHNEVSMLIDGFIAWFDSERARITVRAGRAAAVHPLDRLLAEYTYRRACGEKLNLR